MPAVEYF